LPEGLPPGFAVAQQIATALWNQLEADTLIDRGVPVAGNSETCLRSIAVHEAAGA